MLRRLITSFVALLVLAVPARATWSIILVNIRTGEIAIASATCVPGLDLTVYVPVIVVGKGAGAAQSFIDQTGVNRLLIRDQLRLGTDPAQILALLAASDPSHQTRQYGIVDLNGRAIGFTGTGAGAYGSDRIGQVGDIAYAVQGNVLTGGAVLAAAELALFTTTGDLGDKLMAMMEAARSFGGDGRCSCPAGTPTSCGAPPPGFTKSADIGFMILARPGDVDGTCNAGVGCANGSYYMRLNVAGRTANDPDPVLLLRPLFEQWKTTQVGRPDHFLSTVTLDPPIVPANGLSPSRATVVLRDRDGSPITHGGATVTVSVDPTSTANAVAGPVRDLGDGTYEFDVTAPTRAGITTFLVGVDDHAGGGSRELRPGASLRTSFDRLGVDRTMISASRGGTLGFVIDVRPYNNFPRPWVLLGSMSGTTPGLVIPPGYRLPLNPDPFFDATVIAAFYHIEPGLSGLSPPTGVQATSLTFPPGMYTIPPGTDLSFAFAIVNPVMATSNAVTVHINP